MKPAGMTAPVCLDAEVRQVPGRHLNGDRSDNSVGNLAWSTHIENVADKAAHGTLVRGESVAGAKLTEADVAELRRLHPGQSLSALAKRFGVGKSTVHDAVSGRQWSHLR